MNLRISTFNLYQFCAPPYSYYTKKEKFNDNQWKCKLNWIKETLNHLNSDIIAFQEVFTQDALKDLLKSIGYNYFASVDDAQLKKNVFQTCTVFLASKYPINKVESISTNKDIIDIFNFEKEFEFSRKPIKAHIQIKEKEIVTYVFHLKSNRLNEFEYKFSKDTQIKEKIEKSFNSFSFRNANALQQRICEVLHISNDINHTLKSYENIIALGDLNDKEYSLSIDLLTNRHICEEMIKSKSLNINCLGEIKTQLFDTFYLDKSYKTRPSTSYFRSVGNVIDYILISKRLNKEFINYKIYDNHLKDNKDGSLLKSDHAIVSTNFSI